METSHQENSDHKKNLDYNCYKKQIYSYDKNPNNKNMEQISISQNQPEDNTRTPLMTPNGNQQMPPTGNQRIPGLGNLQTPPNGNQQMPPNENQRIPGLGNLQTPPRGNQQMPPNGNQQMPSRGNQQMPPSGNQQMPPMGNQQMPPSGNQQMPPNGNQRIPGLGNLQIPTNRNQNNADNGHNQLHVHEIQGSVLISGADPHSHRFALISGEEIPYSNTHYHEVSFKTDYFKNHIHEFHGNTTTAINIGDNHIHYLDSVTTTNDGHNHDFKFVTLFEDPTNNSN